MGKIKNDFKKAGLYDMPQIHEVIIKHNHAIHDDPKAQARMGKSLQIAYPNHLGVKK